MALFESSTSAGPDLLVVTVAGECDLSVSGELSSVLLDAISRSPTVVMDLAALRFLDSSGINVMIGAYQAAQERDRRFYAVKAGGVVAHVLDLTGVADLLRAPPGLGGTGGPGVDGRDV